MHADPLATLLALVERPFTRLVLSKPRAVDADLTRVTVRPVVLKGAPRLSFVYTHATRDITRNLEPAEAAATLRTLLADGFGAAHLWTDDEDIELLTSRKGRRTLMRRPAAATRPAEGGPQDPAKHDREKHRYVDQTRPFLAALGVTDGVAKLVPAMARKWKQINKFVEVLDHALAGTALKDAERLDVVDFGSGKGYLTFATHEHLRHTLGLPAFVAGVELREDMVTLCNDAVQELALEGLRFEQGDVRSITPPKIDIMIALHACDTATDHAIHTGLRAGASIIMCSPCCHKELRPQLLQPHPLRPILKHGVHLGQQAEMLTDGLRALLLEACGYETQVFEFVALEHTNKNKMILAVKRANAPAPDADATWRQIDDLKAFYGIRDQCLETLLRAAQRTTTAAEHIALA
jgi:SAM-dependent methyltransferase